LRCPGCAIAAPRPGRADEPHRPRAHPPAQSEENGHQPRRRPVKDVDQKKTNDEEQARSHRLKKSRFESAPTQFDFDTVAALLDTDTDWGPDVARRATAHGIRVLMSEPCFEAMMLRAIKRPAEGSADELKKRFALHVNDDGLEPRNYGATFNDETLQAARRIEKTLDLLLRLLRQ
jgi:hypothetical protein